MLMGFGREPGKECKTAEVLAAKVTPSRDGTFWPTLIKKLKPPSWPVLDFAKMVAARPEALEALCRAALTKTELDNETGLSMPKVNFLSPS